MKIKVDGIELHVEEGITLGQLRALDLVPSDKEVSLVRTSGSRFLNDGDTINPKPSGRAVELVTHPPGTMDSTCNPSAQPPVTRSPSVPMDI